MTPRAAAVGLAGLVAAAGCAAGGTTTGAPGRGGPVAELRAELAEIFADPDFGHAVWGVVVQSVETGEVLYRQNSARLFTPASNQKLVTAAVALARLGAEHRFLTRVAMRGAIRADGVLDGDLVVIGGGDPAISARFSAADPMTSGRFADGDPVAVFRAWADSLRAKGVTRIAGHVVGDDDLFDDLHLGPGWAWDDLHFSYAAEVGALLLNEGVVRFTVTPGDSAGAPARVERQPPTSYLRVREEVWTTADSTGVTVSAERRPFSNDARLWGSIWARRDSVVRHLSVHDPTLYFVTVLTETLEAAGIPVAGGPLDRDSLEAYPPRDSLETLFVHASPPLAEIVRPFLKESQNQIGEMLLRFLGATATDTGSTEAGRRVVEAQLHAWGIPSSHFIIADGSGLSRYNYLSPELLVRLLRAMSRRPEFAAFHEALPVAGADGTLRRRMRGGRAEGNARAKTGFVSNARALSGYVTTLDGELLAFSMISNHFAVPVPVAEYLQDLAVERLANFSRRAGRPAPGSVPPTR